MYHVESIFSDFEPFRLAATNWNLDFSLLSKKDFSAYLNIFSSQKFEISRTRLNGKIKQLGQCPNGFRTITIPVLYTTPFYWLNKKTEGNQLLIFPKNGILDGVSFNNFDVYVISIEESFLFQSIQHHRLMNVERFFNGNETMVNLSKQFLNQFHQIVTDFFDLLKNKTDKSILNPNRYYQTKFEVILGYILNFLNESSPRNFSLPKKKKRDIALEKSLDVITNNLSTIPTLAELCNISGVSERTLQYAFLEKFQVTPNEYIKAIRLNKIRHKLGLSKKEDLTISQLAFDYGFWHMGQFSRDYKKWFGELPSDTLNKKYVKHT